MSAGLFDRQPPKPQARPLLQFKAGKMSMKEDHSVQPDSRKGCAYLYQTTGDQSVHFCWFDRRTGLIEENFVLTPREAEFKRVPQCKSGRVYVLKLKEQQRRFFLWMQEPNASNDSQICETVNKFINSPPTPPSASGTSRSSRMVDLFSGVRGLSNLSQSELLALLSMGVGLNSGLSSENTTLRGYFQDVEIIYFRRHRMHALDCVANLIDNHAYYQLFVLIRKAMARLT
ncbi:unnamed protein product [Mesocestoides corti]|uniref:Pru domain-containing protein n=1 Tax=Mesocestoides corti TaxID=53468 RepID=A0A0R3U2A7_MESCO|nr:unnamed protein product [Mesocestoides corti]